MAELMTKEELFTMIARLGAENEALAQANREARETINELARQKVEQYDEVGANIGAMQECIVKLKEENNYLKMKWGQETKARARLVDKIRDLENQVVQERRRAERAEQVTVALEAAAQAVQCLEELAPVAGRAIETLSNARRTIGR